MNKDLTFEIRREVLHILLGILIMLLVSYYKKAAWVLFFVLICGALLSLLSLHFKVPLVHWFLMKFERKRYLKRFPGKGPLFYVAGALLVLKLFETNTALASIAILTFGDSFSHVFGKILKNKEKEIESVVIGVIFATIAASFFISPLLAFAGSCISMAIEFFGLKLGQDNVDDNFFIPLIAGTTIYLLAKYI